MQALTDAAPVESQNIKRRAFIATIYTYVGKYGNTALAFPITLLLVRGLSIQDYGVYNLFISILFFASVLSNLGSLGIVQRYIPEFAQKGETANIRQTVKLSFLLRLAGGLLCVGILAFFSDTVFSLLNISENYRDFIPFISLLILVSIEVQLLGDGVLGAMLKQKALTFGSVASKSLQLIAIFLALAFGYRLKGVIVGWLCSLTFLFIYYLWKVYLEIRAERTNTVAALPGRRMLRYGSFYLIAVFGTVFLDVAIDNFVIAHYLGEIEVGRYAFAVKIASLTMSVVPINLLTPIVVNVAIRCFAEKGTTDVLSRIFVLFNKLIFFGVMPAALGVFLLSDSIIVHVFDSKYASIDSIVKVAILFSVVRFYLYAFQTLVKPLELLHLNLYRYACSFINLVLNFWLVPNMGIMGAAIATGGTSVLNYAIINILVRRHVKLRQDWNAIARMSLNLLAMSAVIYPMRAWITDFSGLVSIVALGAVAYFAVSYFNKPFTGSERQLLNDTLGRKIWVF